MPSRIERRVYELVEPAESGNRAGEAFNGLVMVLIVLNMAAIVLASFKELYDSYRLAFDLFEDFSVGVFTLEYLLRLAAARPSFPDSKRPYLRRIGSFMSVVDLLAILPFYLPFLVSVDLRFLRALRLLRVLRILKLGRYSESTAVIIRVLKREKAILLTTLAMIGVLLFLASCLMYTLENAAQPDKFTDIVSSAWWAIITLTTVGYGDVYPITPLGKMLSGCIAVLGIGFVALPTGILSSGFINEVNKSRKSRAKCPHCGKDLEE